MRTFPLFVCAAAALPLAPHALEAVAQSPVGGGSAFGAANLATDAKISVVKAETAALKQTVNELKTELKNVTDCAVQGKIWDGSACVIPQAVNQLFAVSSTVNNTVSETVIFPGTLCGWAFWETRDHSGDASDTFWVGNINNYILCNGTRIISPDGNGSCPQGWRFQITNYSWGVNGGYNYRYRTATCTKE